MPDPGEPSGEELIQLRKELNEQLATKQEEMLTVSRSERKDLKAEVIFMLIIFQCIYHP